MRARFGVAVRVRVRIGIGVRVRVRIRVGIGVRVGVGIRIRVCIGVGVAIRIGVAVDIGIGIGACVRAGISVRIRIRVGVRLTDVRFEVGATALHVRGKKGRNRDEAEPQAAELHIRSPFPAPQNRYLVHLSHILASRMKTCVKFFPK
jgi:hypothetical protein